MSVIYLFKDSFSRQIYQVEHQMQTYGYQIEEAQKTKEQLSEIGRQLRLERASLRNPQRIDAIARGELGMVIPAPGQLVTSSADSPLNTPTLPGPTMQLQAQPAALTAKR